MSSAPQEKPGPAHFRRLHVEGYRSFGAPLTLEDLDRIVVVYGLNNAGKTNLLRAIAFLAKLIDQPLARVLDDTPEPQELFFKRTGQDKWMFAQGRPDRIQIECHLAPADHRFIFVIERKGERVQTRLQWLADGVDRAAQAAVARDTFLSSMTAGAPDTLADQTWKAAEETWDEMRRLVRVAWSASWLPIPDETRAAFVQLGRAPDRRRRARAQRAKATFAKVVAGLPPGGALEDLTEPLPVEPGGRDQPRIREDVAWASPDYLLPLDHLGSGAQAIFGMVASMALAEATTLLVDEPEQHLNVLQQEAIVLMLRAALEDGGFGQVFIATHSVKFAKSDLCLWQLEREAGATRAKRVTPSVLRGYEMRSDDGPRAEVTSMMAHDGSVELPGFVREALHVEPGQFVYFVPGDDGGFRILSEAEMDKALGDE